MPTPSPFAARHILSGIVAYLLDRSYPRSGDPSPWFDECGGELGEVDSIGWQCVDETTGRPHRATLKLWLRRGDREPPQGGRELKCFIEGGGAKIWIVELF